MGIETQLKGRLGEIAFEKEAIERGYIISKPTIESADYDLIVDRYKQHPERIQIKSRKLTRGAVQLKITKYKKQNVDAIILYILKHDKLIWIPSDVFDTKSVLTIRFLPTKNNQNKKVPWYLKFINW